MSQNSTWLKKGMRDGIPISLGYFAVAITLGITARQGGITAIQATIASLTNNASAGQYAGFTIIANKGSYLEMALMILVVNIRYMLMSCALSQKLDYKVPTWQRLLLGYGITDEIFGVSVSVKGKLNPFYSYGAIGVAAPGWALGTYIGVVMGNVLPESVVSALSVGLYGMFLAVIIPPVRESKIITTLIVVSMALSYIVHRLSCFAFISSGFKIILLTVVLSFAFAIVFPVKEETPDGI